MIYTNKLICILIAICLSVSAGCHSLDVVHSPSTEAAYVKVVEWENYMIKGKLLDRVSDDGTEPEEDPPDGILALRFQCFLDSMVRDRSANHGYGISTHELKRRFYDPIVMKYGLTKSLAETSLYFDSELKRLSRYAPPTLLYIAKEKKQ